MTIGPFHVHVHCHMLICDDEIVTSATYCRYINGSFVKINTYQYILSLSYCRTCFNRDNSDVLTNGAHATYLSPILPNNFKTTDFCIDLL